MKRKTNKTKFAKAFFALLLFAFTVGGAKAQPAVHFGTADADGNGVAGNFYYGANAYLYP